MYIYLMCEYLSICKKNSSVLLITTGSSSTVLGLSEVSSSKFFLSFRDCSLFAIRRTVGFVFDYAKFFDCDLALVCLHVKVD